MTFTPDHGQRHAADKALESVYQGDPDRARAACRTHGAKLAVFYADAARGLELWPELAGEWKRITA